MFADPYEVTAYQECSKWYSIDLLVHQMHFSDLRINIDISNTHTYICTYIHTYIQINRYTHTHIDR